MRLSLILICFIFFCLISLPFIYAQQAAGEAYVFGGFLFNPSDGNSYLAKMYQGWRGDWLFRLPYTAEPGDGAYLFLFYIFLGHLARFLSIPLLWVFHLARIVAACLLIIGLWKFIKSLDIQETWCVPVFVILLFGSGMGWMFFPFGILTSDFTVPEAYPFFSSLVNVHFPLGLALILFLLLGLCPMDNQPKRRLLSDWRAGLGALLLAFVDPFGLVILICVLIGLLSFTILLLLYRRREIKCLSNQDLLADITPISIRILGIRLGWVILLGIPLVLYDFLAANLDPVLAGWNKQNLTPSPHFWDLLLSLSPALLLGILGCIWVIRERHTKAWLLLFWIFVAILLIYFPVNLQRRFMKGLYIPVAALMAFGFIKLARDSHRYLKLILAGTLLCSLITNFLLLLVAFFGVNTHSSWMYLSAGEAQALEWIEGHTQSDALILAAPQTGLFIPAHTGRRVIYGHPFETVNAQQEKDTLEKFFSGENPTQNGFLLEERQVNFVFYGPREEQLGVVPDIPQLQEVYNQDDVTIYKVIPDIFD